MPFTYDAVEPPLNVAEEPSVRVFAPVVIKPPVKPRLPLTIVFASSMAEAFAVPIIRLNIGGAELIFNVLKAGVDPLPI